MPTIGGIGDGGNSGDGGDGLWYATIVDQFATQLFELGYPLIPVNGKIPVDANWQTRFYPLDELRRHAAVGNGVGLPFGFPVKRDAYDYGADTYLVGLDIDFTDERLIASFMPALPVAPLRFGRYPKCLLPVRVRLEEAYSRDIHFSHPTLGRQSLQIIGRSQTDGVGPKQAVMCGLHPDTGLPYRWQMDRSGRAVAQMRPGDWPYVELGTLLERIAEALAPSGWIMENRPSANGADDWDGEITAEMNDDARKHFFEVLHQIEGMTIGSGRGTEATRLGASIGLVIKAGWIDEDDAADLIQNAAPDNENIRREFLRGVEASKGDRQRAIAARAAWPQLAVNGWIAEHGSQVREEPKPAPPTAKDANELAHAVCDIAVASFSSKSVTTRERLPKLVKALMGSLIGAKMIGVQELLDLFGEHAMTIPATNTAKCRRALDFLTELKELAPGDPKQALDAVELMRTGIKASDAARKVLKADERETVLVEGGATGVLIDPESLNERFAILHVAGYPPVYIERKNGALLNETELDRATPGLFNEYLDKNGDVQYNRASRAWRISIYAHVYTEIVFTNKVVQPNQYNLFRDFGITPRQGDCSLIKRHVLEVICNNDRKSYEALLNFLAWQLQHVGEPSRVALTVMTVRQQTGKGIFFEGVMLKIWGPAGANFGNAEALAGRFDAPFIGCGFALFDEVAFSGHQGIADKIKRLVTAKTMQIEAKYQNPRSYPMAVNVVMLSNHENAAHIEWGDARSWILTPSEDRRGDHAYFAPLAAQIEGGGPAAFLHELLARDVSAFVPQRDCPMENEAKRQMAALSERPGTIRAWLVGCVLRGSLGSPGATFGGEATTIVLHDLYSAWYKEQRAPRLADFVNVLGFKLSRYGFERAEPGRGRRDADGKQQYPPWLIPSRARLAELLGVELEDQPPPDHPQPPGGNIIWPPFKPRS